MKKMMLLMVVLGGSNCGAFEDFQAAAQESLPELVNNRGFFVAFDEYTAFPDQMDKYTVSFEQRREEYVANENAIVQDTSTEEQIQAQTVDPTADYEQNISDSVQPPVISSTQQMLARILGALLVKYINARETAQFYFGQAKDVLSKWYNYCIAKL